MITLLFRKFNSLLYYLKQYTNKKSERFLEVKLFIKVLFVYGIINSKAKVAIGTTFNPKGGVANHILSLHKYLKISNTIVPSYHASITLGEKGKYNLLRLWVNKYNLLKNNVLHSHADVWFINYCKRQQENRSIKWVHTYHLPYFKEFHGDFLDWQIEMNQSLFDTAKQADIKISVGKWLKEYLKDEYNINTIYIPNCVDYDKCQLANANRFIKTFNLKDFILFASKLDYVKNPVEFVKLSALMPQEQFVIIGSNITKEALENLYKQKLPLNLHVVSGYLDHETLLDAMAASKLFVMTSRIEGLPTTLMEAMALGKPVVASKVHGCEELLDNEKYGYLYDLGDIEMLRNKTIVALTDSEIGIIAKQHVRQNFDWKVIIPQIDAVYQNLIDG